MSASAVFKSFCNVLIALAFVVIFVFAVTISASLLEIAFVLLVTVVVKEVTSDAFCATLAFVVVKLFDKVLMSLAFVVIFVVFVLMFPCAVAMLVVFVFTVLVKEVTSLAF